MRRRISRQPHGKKCRFAVGIEPDFKSAEQARKLNESTENAEILCTSFENYRCPQKFDAVIFVASLHHISLPLSSVFEQVKEMLSPNGKLIVVGCAASVGIKDKFTDILRVVPAKLGSVLHGEKIDDSMVIKPPPHTLREINEAAEKPLSVAKTRQMLYYRYFLLWKKV